MARIFINYRREDARADARSIRDRLVTAFGARNVFMDVDNLLAGQRFDQELKKALDQSDVFLAVMGPRWQQVLAERAQTQGRDYVREEIAEALRRGITVIPVMLERTALPQEEALPEDIRPLVLHQKHDISHDRFGRDVDELIQAIRAAGKGRGAGAGAAVPWRKIAAGVVAAVVVGAGALFGLQAVEQVWLTAAEEAVRSEQARQEQEAQRKAEEAAAKRKEQQAAAAEAKRKKEEQRIAAAKKASQDVAAAKPIEPVEGSAPKSSPIVANKHRVGPLSLGPLDFSPSGTKAIPRGTKVEVNFAYELCCSESKYVWAKPVFRLGLLSGCGYTYTPATAIAPGQGVTSRTFTVGSEDDLLCSSADLAAIEIVVGNAEDAKSEHKIEIPVD